MAQAQRKSAEQFSAAPEKAPQRPQGEVAVALSEAIQSADHYRASPARQMQEQLAAWADKSASDGRGAGVVETMPVIDDVDAVVDRSAAVLPAWQRFAIIGSTSLALWIGIVSTFGLILPIW